MRAVCAIAITCMLCSLVVSCTANGAQTAEEEAEQAIVSFLELCKKGKLEEACEKYMLSDVPKPYVLEEEFDYSILNIVKDEQIETCYTALTGLEFKDGMILNVSFRYNTEDGKINLINTIVRNP